MKAKKILLGILSMVCFGFSVFAITSCDSNNTDSSEYYTEGLKFTLLQDGENYKVSVGQATDFNIVIPSVYKGKPVTIIDDYGFANSNFIESITISDSVEMIGECAFLGCGSLENISIGKNVKRISEGAFLECSFLEEIVVPNSVERIGQFAFNGCNSLTKMSIPFVGAKLDGTNNTHFGYIFGASEYSSNDVYIPANLKNVIISGSQTINDYAFHNCGMLEEVELSNSITTIGYGAFSGCDSLTKMSIPFVGAKLDGTNNTHFGYIFGASEYSSNDVYIPANLKNVIISGSQTINDYAFYNCDLLEKVELPNTLKTIGIQSFLNCDSLTSITIPDSVTSIGGSAFAGCISLDNVKIGSNVENIAGNVFSGCKSLENIVVDKNNRYYDSRNNCNAIIETSNNTLITGCKNTVIPDSVTSIGESSFSGCSSLTNITIPNGVTSIGEWAFSGCSSLTNIKLPDGITSIAAGTFSLCNSLKNIKIPDSVTYIDGYAFHDCSSLTNIVIPDSVTSIKWFAFSYCNALISVTLGNGVKCIDKGTFLGCYSLMIITIPDSVTNIVTQAFDDCDSLTEVYYIGTEKQWDSVLIENYNDPLIKANIIFHNHDTNNILSLIPATCIRDGVITYYCDSCNRNYLVVIPAGHTEVIDAEIPATCTTTGLTEGKHCSECQQILVKQEIVPALNHDYQVSKQVGATCEQDGYTTYVCSHNTMHTYTNIQEKTGHTEVIDAAVPATCTTTGLTEGKHCSVCKTVLVKQEVVPTIPHKEVIDAAVPATCTTTGLTEGSHCSVCNIILLEQKVVALKMHNYENDICTECGSMNYTQGLEFTLSSDGKNYSVSNYTGISKDIIIPSIYKNKYVTSIDMFAFKDCYSITSVTIPDSVTTIGAYAFVNCSSLTSITIPHEVNTIAVGAFCGCGSLINITIPNSVTSIGGYAFYECGSLTSIIIPDSVTSIGGYAFYECGSLETVYYTGSAEQWNNISGISTSGLNKLGIIIYYKYKE